MPQANMLINKSYKTELKLNNEQKTLCLKAAGVARFVFNWGLEIKIKEYKKTGKSPNHYELDRRLNHIKKDKFPWMYDVSNHCCQEALKDLEAAFVNFFRRVKKGEKPGFPKFKSKRNGSNSFRLKGHIRIRHDRVKLPKLGLLRLKEHNYIPTEAVKILSATISKRSDRWFVSVNVEEDIGEQKHNGKIIGVDIGVKNLIATSDGEFFKNQKYLARKERKIKRLHRFADRKEKDSTNRKKAIKLLAKQYYKISCARKDSIHKMTDLITKNYEFICMESLNTKGMVRNHNLSKSILDASFGEIARQLEYKTKWRGGTLVKADRFFPSSKMCSNCGHIKDDLKLSHRIYCCDNCGFVIDRDLNAAINLKNTVSSTGINACGDGKVAGDLSPVVVDEARNKHQTFKFE